MSSWFREKLGKHCAAVFFRTVRAREASAAFCMERGFMPEKVVNHSRVLRSPASHRPRTFVDGIICWVMPAITQWMYGGHTWRSHQKSGWSSVPHIYHSPVQELCERRWAGIHGDSRGSGLWRTPVSDHCIEDIPGQHRRRLDGKGHNPSQNVHHRPARVVLFRRKCCRLCGEV